MNEDEKDVAALGFIVAVVGFAVCLLLTVIW
jgi:hypothetical protein